MTPKFDLRQRVRLRAAPSDVGVVLDILPADGEPSYDVFFDAYRQQVYPEHALLGMEDGASPSTPTELLKAWQLSSAEDFGTHLTYQRLTHKLAGTVYSYMASK